MLHCAQFRTLGPAQLENGRPKACVLRHKARRPACSGTKRQAEGLPAPAQSGRPKACTGRRPEQGLLRHKGHRNKAKFVSHTETGPLFSKNASGPKKTLCSCLRPLWQALLGNVPISCNLAQNLSYEVQNQYNTMIFHFNFKCQLRTSLRPIKIKP